MLLFDELLLHVARKFVDEKGSSFQDDNTLIISQSPYILLAVLVVEVDMVVEYVLGGVDCLGPYHSI